MRIAFGRVAGKMSRKKMTVVRMLLSIILGTLISLFAYRPGVVLPITPSVKYSFVFASRNDNYNGHPAALRLEASLKALYSALHQYDLSSSSEILIVDWASENPLSESVPLKRLSVRKVWPK